MPAELYGLWASAPCRVVSLTLEATSTPYEYKNVDLQKGEHKTPEYLKMNPQHNIPTFKDADGFTMNESRAIASYIAAKYDKSGKLYPADAKARARVDQRLHFDMGTFYKAFSDVVYPIAFNNAKVTEDKYDRLKEVLGWANDFVKETGYVAGTDHYTIADLAFLASYSTMSATPVVDFTPYAELNAWFEKMKKEVPNYEKADGKGAKEFSQWVNPKLEAA